MPPAKKFVGCRSCGGRGDPSAPTRGLCLRCYLNKDMTPPVCVCPNPDTDEIGECRKCWDARARRVARQLGIEIGIGEPGDGLTVRLEALEELADRFSHVIDHIERNQ
jgi:hypothetical protein